MSSLLQPSTVVRFYCLSGLISLGYQVVWFRLYADRFGSDGLTFVIVLSGFIAGLGVGAIFSRAVCRLLSRRLRTTDGLRLYGVLELFIASLVGLTVLLIGSLDGWWGDFPYRLDEGVYVLEPGYRISLIALAGLSVATPSFFMGTTYPLLCSVLAGARHTPSRLYAWNTLGACTGVLLCQFVAFHYLGDRWTLLLLVALNAAIGVYFVSQRASAPLDLAVRAGDTASSRDAIWLLALGGLSGLLTGAVEGDLLKRLWFLGTNSGAAMAFISFWAIAGIFLASATVTASRRLRLGHIKAAFAAAFVVYALTWHFAYDLRNLFRDYYARALAEGVGVEVSASTADLLPSVLANDLLFTFLFVGVFSFPVIYLLALALPFVCNRAGADSRLLARVYGLNTLCFCAGVVGFVWLAPRVDIFYSLKLTMVLLAIGVVAFCVLPRRGRPAVLVLTAAAFLLTLGAVLTPRGFDKNALDPARRAYHFPVRALKSNGSHTTYVVETPEGDALYFDSHPMSATALEAQIYMRLMAHFPLLAQATPRAALLIGFGVGNTASAIAEHRSIERIDVVDLNRRVIETAPEFAPANGAVHRDPRVRFFVDDGRRFLARTRNHYDLITSEPPPPMQDGVYRLYSTEYYRTALSKLAPRGLLTQWLPISQLPNTVTELMVASFQSVFPETLLLSGYGAQLILVGGREPIDLTLIEQRLASEPAIASELERLRMPSPLHLFSRVLKSDEQLDREYAGRPVISDRRNDLAYQVGATLELSRVRFDPHETIELFEHAELEVLPELRATYAHLGRLFYRLPDFPLNWLSVETGKERTVPLGAARWPAIVAALDAYRAALRGNDLAAAESFLLTALAQGKEQPYVLLALGRLQLARQRFDEAAATLQRFLTIEPSAPEGHLHLVHALLGRHRVLEALGAAERALALGRRTPEAYRARALARLGNGQPLLALEDYDQALSMAPDDLGLVRERTRLVDQLRAGTGG